MAQTVKDDDEREKRILLVGNLVKETGMSTRKLSNYITKNFFPISNCTVSDYIKRYCKLKPEELNNIKAKIYDNSTDGLNKEEIKQRVKVNSKLFVQGYTIEEIATETGISFWSVYRDITSRIRAIDPDYYEESIKPRLKENKMENLKK